MLKPLLDDGFGKADHSFLENDGICCRWYDYIAWGDQLCLYLLPGVGIR